jgi:hypothetical protein
MAFAKKVNNQPEFTQEELDLFWEPVDTREELQEHIRTYLKIDLIDCKVDELSTSTPLDFVWDVYTVMKTNKGPHIFTVAANRNGAKTLCASIARFYAIIHFRRTGTHLAANLQQSGAASIYLNQFLQLPYVAPYVVIDNSRQKILKGMPPNSHTKNGDATLLIAVATIGGVNSQRGSFNTRDELDLISESILNEASFIADPTRDEHQFEPIEINLSSRKTATGPIQRKIDAALEGKNKNLAVAMWSQADWIRACPPEVHKPLPDGQTIPAWINKETLKITWSPEILANMTSSEKSLQHEVAGHEGCKTCPIFAVCQGRAVRQTSESSMLRTIEFVDTLMQGVDNADKLIAQALNWKPESSSSVFRTFSRSRHFLKPIDLYHWAFNKIFNPSNLSPEEIQKIADTGDPVMIDMITPKKSDIYQELVRQKWAIHYGVDWGYSPAEATCVVVAYHRRQKRAIVLHVAMSQGHANNHWADYIAKEIWSKYPGDLVCPDLEDPSSPMYFGVHSIPAIDDKPRRIEPGVSQIRSLLWSPASQQSNFAILDDGDDGIGKNIRMVKAIESWTHLKTALGFNFDKYEDDHNCDYTDPLRYALAPFINTEEVKMSSSQGSATVGLVAQAAKGSQEARETIDRMNTAKSQMSDYMEREHGIKNIYKTEEKVKKEQSPAKGNGGVKFKF